MILDFRCSETQALFPAGKSRRSSAIAAVSIRKRVQPGAACEYRNLRSPPGNRLVALKGNRKGQHGIVHPGEVLREDFVVELGMSVNALARALKVPAPRVSDTMREGRAISADTALRLASHFDFSPQFWLNLQAACVLCVAEIAAGKRIEREVSVMSNAA